MQDNTQDQPSDPLADMQPRKVAVNSKPNESGSFYITGFVRIHDPNSDEVYLESRE